jgi:bacterioferritin-associated ferredoxin
MYLCICAQVQQQRMQKIVARQGPTVSTPPTATKGALKSTSSKVVGMAGWGSACQTAMQKKRLPTACSNSKSARAATAGVLTCLRLSPPHY